MSVQTTMLQRSRRRLVGGGHRSSWPAGGVVAVVAVIVALTTSGTGGGAGGGAAAASGGTLSAPVIATIPVGPGPRGIDMFGGGELIAVAIGTGLALVDPATNTAIGDIAVPGESSTVAVAASAGGSRTYLGTDAGIAEVDTSSEAGAVFRSVVPVGGPVSSFAVTPDAAWIYAATGKDVVAINRASGARAATVAQPGAQSFGMAVDPAGHRVYVANTDVNSVTAIDIATDTVLATIPTGTHTFDVAITPDGTRGYVANEAAITVFDTQTYRVIATIAVPEGGILEDITITGDGRRAFLTTQSGIAVVDTTTNTLLDTIAVPTTDTPGDVAISPDRPGAYISSTSTDTILVLDVSNL